MAQMEITGKDTARTVEKAIARTPDDAREAIFKDIEATIGMVPGFFRTMPAPHLEAEWRVFKELELGASTALDPKTKHLVALSIAGSLACPYCTLFHTVAAGLNGATAEEINEVGLIVKNTLGWSRYFSTIEYDMNQFRQEVDEVRKHLIAKRGAAH